MKLRRCLTASLRQLREQPLRTLLALAGIAVGAGAFLVARAVGEGAQQEMEYAVEAFGTDLLLVKPLPVKVSVARRQVSGWSASLREEDITAIAALPLIRGVAPAIEANLRVKADGIAARTKVRGTTTAYLALRRFTLADGRFLTANDESQRRRVAVLGASLARQLFPAGRPVGCEIRIGGVPFEVVGTLAAKGATTDSADQDNQILIPLATALRRVFNARALTSAYVGVVDSTAVPEAEIAVTALLRQRHRCGTQQRPDDFAVQNTAKTRSTQVALTSALGQYGTGLALLALFVGGAGMLTLMLLGVRERTAEIGLRMAVGARPADILGQFLIESGLLALGGWAVGTIGGAIATAAVAFSTGWTVGVPIHAALVSLALSLGIGFGFGVLPARRAARIPPIRAIASR